MAQSETEYYFQRFGFCDRQILTPPAPDLGLVVVIPCFNEPDLMGSLESLRACDKPGCAVEVIVIINSSANTNIHVRAQNEKTLKTATEWAHSYHLCSECPFTLHILHFPDLPPKQAGVGL